MIQSRVSALRIRGSAALACLRFNTLLSIDSNMLENGAIALPMLPGLIERWSAATKTLLAESQSLGRVVAAKHHDGVRCGVHSHAQNVRGSAQDVLKCATC